MVAYADTSFLLSLYGQDTGSSSAQQLATELGCPFAFTPLHRLEARNALRLAIFRSDITAKQAKAVMVTMEDDEKTGVLANSPVGWAEVFDRAEEFSASHTANLGTRTMDILHVAAASVLNLQDFLTFDKREAELAKKVGMTVRLG